MKISYREGYSMFHRVDPIMKFIWVVIVSVWLFNLRDIASVFVVSVSMTILAILGSNLQIKQYLKISIMLFIGSLFIILYQGFVRHGDGIVLGPITLSYVGLSIGTAICLRTFGLVASALAFSTTTSPQDFEMSLTKLGMSYKMAKICYLSLRLIPIFERDFQTLDDAQRLRNVKKGMSKTVKSVVAFIGTELRHADDIAIALDTRGFGLYPERTQLYSVSISRRGILLVSGTIVLMIIHLYIVYF
jgi:energy-coupling factor transport system permease protein